MPFPARLRLPRSLGAKLVLILTGVGLIGATALTLLLATVITPNFNRLERDSIAAHVARTEAVVVDLAAKVENAVRDYGDWNASWDYMAAPSRAFEDESFSTLAMVNLDVDGMAYVRPDRSVVIARWIDGAREVELPAKRNALVLAIGRVDLERLLAGRSSAGFYLKLGDALAAVGIARVRRSDGSGAPRGYVLMARSVTSSQLSTLLQLEASLAPPVATVTVTPEASHTRIAVPIPGPDGRAVAAVAYSVSRDLSTLGKRMLVLAVLASSLLLAVVLLVLRRMITRLVLQPLHRVERHMGVVRRSGEFSLLTERPRDDEIGSLVASFNSMLSQLRGLREQVEVQSFTLGRSESAVAVMHNVRNALNPVTTVLSEGLEREAIDRAALDKALAELSDPALAPERRRKLALFLTAALDAIERERADRREQLGIGRAALRQVLEIIGTQQESANARPALGTCDVSEIIAQNATIARYSGETSIAFSFPSRPHLVRANRVILSQVIGNLFANAGEAIAAAGKSGGSIAVSVKPRGDRLEIVIRDDGEGFDPALTSALFQRGFSTRAHKSGGLGLHWCANSMLAMDGTLELRSDGRGTGARAVLTLVAASVVSDELAA